MILEWNERQIMIIIKIKIIKIILYLKRVTQLPITLIFPETLVKYNEIYENQLQNNQIKTHIRK